MDHIKVNGRGEVQAFIGHKATDVAHLVTLRHAIKLWLTDGLVMARGAGPAQLARLASAATGKKYVASKNSLGVAYSDLKITLEEAKKQVAIVHEEPK